MSIRALSLVVLAGALAGCVRVHVPEDAFFVPNTRLVAEGITIPDGGPMPEGTRELSLASEGGPVSASLAPGRPDGSLIVFCGGNMFRRSATGAATAETLAPFGDVLMFDYPGYGETPGEATIPSFTEAATAVATEARRLADEQGRKVVAWGHSMGGPICAEVARHIGADALVLEATTPTARAAVNDQVGLMRPFVRVSIDPGLDSFDVVRTLNGYAGRVVVLEARHDDVLAPRLSREMARDLTESGVDVRRLVFSQAGHNDIRRQPDMQSRVAAALAD